MKEYPVTCYCGSPAHLHGNEKRYGRPTGKVPFMYICDRYIAAIEEGKRPPCFGSVGVHPSGKPLGTIPDEHTKKLRQQVHRVLDKLWQNRPYQQRRGARRNVYTWLARLMDMNAEECHIGNFTAQDCYRALIVIGSNEFQGKKSFIGYDEFNNKETF